MRRNTHTPQAAEATRAASRTAYLVSRANDGDSDALACLIGQHERSLSRFCRRLVGAGEAEDLVQETLLRAVQAIPHLKDPDRFAAWLFGIAANLARKWWEQRARWPLSLDALARVHPDIPWDQALSLDGTVTPDEVVEQAEHARRLGEAIASLPAALRRVLTLHYLDGHSYAEIAEALKVPLSTVRGRLFTSRTRLLRELTGSGVVAGQGLGRARGSSQMSRKSETSQMSTGGSQQMEPALTTPDASLIPVTLDSVRFYEPDWPDCAIPLTEADVRGTWNPISKPPWAGPLVHEEVVRVAERIADALNEAHLRIGTDLRVAVLKTGDAEDARSGLERYVPIVIGFSEATAIVVQQRGVQPSRPLTHDLLCQTLDAFGARLVRVVLTDGGEYTIGFRAAAGQYRLPMIRATMVLRARRREIRLDARASDALAVAVRTAAPMFVDRATVERYGLAADDDPAKVGSSPFVGRMTGGFRLPPIPS